MQSVDEGCVDLKHGLAAGQHGETPLPPLAPERGEMRRERRRVSETAAALGVHADEIRIAEAALRRGAVGLPAAPQIAAGETAEHGRAARMTALALQRLEGFLD